MTTIPDPTKHLLGYGRRDVTTGMLHGHIRFPDGSAPTPFGCRWCGTEQGGHGGRWMPGKGVHRWEQPTQAQIKARMLARRNARHDVREFATDARQLAAFSLRDAALSGAALLALLFPVAGGTR